MTVAVSGGGPAALRGAVIRAWRQYADVGVRELARLLSVSPGAVSNWESGLRARKSAARVPLVADIAQKLGLPPDEQQAFKDMWLAAASVTAIEPRPCWAHNYQWPSGPGWVWLRCPDPPGTLAVKGWWSDPLQGVLEMEVGAGGVFVQFPRTIPNPPLEVVFGDLAGWADFGKGTVPGGVAGQFGATVVDARTLARPVDQFEPAIQKHVFMRLLGAIRDFKKAVDQFGPAWDLIRPHLGVARFDRPPHPAADPAAFRALEDAGIRVDDSGWIVSQAVAEPERFRLVRDARGLSREATAAQVTAMDQEHPLTASTLRTYEETGVIQAADRIFSRLDTAYGTDGWFGLDVVHDSRSSPYAREGIRFPRYWQGPVWIQVRGPGEDATGLVDFTWGPWRRRQYVFSGTVLTTRKATHDMAPLIYQIPAGWQIRAGVGAIPAALDINHGWYPKDIAAALGLLTSHVRRLPPGDG